MDWPKVRVAFDFTTRLWRKTLNMRSSSLTGIRATCQRCRSVKQINRHKFNIKHTCGKSCVGSAVARSGLGGNGELALTSLTIGRGGFSFSGVACLGDFRTGSSSFCPSSWLSSRLRFKTFSSGTVDVSERISNCKRKKLKNFIPSNISLERGPSGVFPEASAPTVPNIKLNVE